MRYLCFVSSVFIIILCNLCFAQTDSTYVQEIELNDGSRLVGRIISEDSLMIRFETKSGLELDIERSKIKEIAELKSKWIDKQVLRKDPNQTRLFFGPTGRTLKKGKGYFSVIELFFPMVAYGITDQFTMSGGISLFPGLDFSEQVVYFAPKLRLFKTEQIHISTGVLYISIPDHNMGIAFGTSTYISKKAGVTAGLGYGFAEGDFADYPLLMLGGDLRLGRNSKLITEIWIPPEIETFISLGIRFFGKSLAADFALMTVSDAEGSFPFFPLLGFAYNF